MKKINTVFLSLGFTFLLACCVHKRVTVTFYPNIDFKEYKSFAWLEDITGSVSGRQNPDAFNKTRAHIGKELIKRGFAPDTLNPDLLLQLVMRSDKQTREFIFLPHSKYGDSDLSFPGQYDRYYYSKRKVYCYPQGYCSEEIDYLERSVTLNVIDRKENVQVWSATVLENIADTSMRNKNIHSAVKAILKRFPR